MEKIVIDFQSGQWLPATQVARQFVKHPNSKDSPGKVWKYTSDSTQINLSVIIPTFDAYRNGYFVKLLSQIGRQDYSGFELIVVKGDPRQGRAINIGATLAKGKYIVTLDDDTSLPDPETFLKLVSVMETNPDVGIAGGNNVTPEEAGPFIQRVMKEIPRRSWKPVESITDSDLPEHPLLIIRKEVFMNVGGENELIPRGLDPYLREKFREAGYRIVVVPDVSYSHLPPSNMPKLIKQFYRNGKKAAFCNKFYPQWVIETPDSHVRDFIPRRPFVYRVARHVVNMLKNIHDKHWVYVIATSAYATGFVSGYLTYRKRTLD